MNRHLEEIFNECIERLRQGDSIENCLLNYPEEAAEIEPLLRTASNINWRASMVQPRPEFKARARYQFINAQYAEAQAKEARFHPTLFSLQRAWMPALVMVLLLVFSSVGTAAAASNAMPDQPLYPVKLATEQVQLTLAFSNETKAELNTKLMETRSQEIITMATQGKTDQVIAATARLAQNLEAAETALNKVEETKTRQFSPPPRPATLAPTQPAPSQPLPPPASSDKTKENTGPAGGQTATTRASVEADKLRQSVTASINKNLASLENAQEKTSEKAKEALQRAIELTKNKQIQIQKPRDTDTKDKPGLHLPTPQGGIPKPFSPGVKDDDVKPPNLMPGTKLNPTPLPPVKSGSGSIGDGGKPPINPGPTDKR
jgi:hypothetical protein